MSMLAHPLDYFPLPEPREKQVKSLDFFQRMYDKKFNDIVIAAPTGIGKTGVGVAICFWAAQTLHSDYKPGGYYLVTQKLLQDQLENDFSKYLPEFNGRCTTLKSSSEYPCPRYKNCKAGSRMPDALCCPNKTADVCSYTNQRDRFMKSVLAVTNYPYFFTERTYIQRFEPRNVIILDEAHSIERQILGFIDVHITRESMEEWAPFLHPESLDTIEDFAIWLKRKYVGAVRDAVTGLEEKAISQPRDDKVQTALNKAENHYNRIQSAMEDMLANPDNWVYWQEEKDNFLESIAKPLHADQFAEPLIHEPAHVRVYLSAYPGPKKVFCRNLGLDPAKVAWINLNSTFPVEHRPVHMLMCGSMGRKNIDETTPRIARMIESILAAHKNEKGLIHGNSYKLCDALFQLLSKTEHASRIIYPRKADEREEGLKRHNTNGAPTVLLSPSMTEGFSLNDDLARFQIIAKCLDSKTRLLTRSGLKCCNELTQNDMAFCLDSAGNGVWSPVQQIIIKDFCGKMLEIKNTSSSMCVTPDHRVLVRQTKDFLKRPLSYVTANDATLFSRGFACPVKPDCCTGIQLPEISLCTLIKPSDLLVLIKPTVRTPSTYLPFLKHNPGSLNWTFTGAEQIPVAKKLGTICFQGRPQCKLSPINYPTADFMELLGWYIAEGCLFGIDSSKGVQLTQTKPVGKKAIARLLNKLKIHWTYTGKDFKIKSDLLYRFFEQEIPFGSKNKNIPRWVLDLDTPYLLRLLRGLMLGDGHVFKSGTKIYYTSSKALAESMCELALKTGYSPALSSTKRGYQITLQTRTYQTFKRQYAKWIDYTGIVWCVSTPLSNFLAERDGRFFFTGNCPFPYLGDRQVLAKKELDPEWYTLQTVSTIIQACGRIVRSDTDYGITYILDSDFIPLFEKNPEFFPPWFVGAFVWHNKE